MEFFSPVQCVGYVAFIVGVAAFLQKSDRRLKILSASQCLVYAVHFVLLGNFPAVSTLLVACVRSLLALKRRSAVVPTILIVVNVAAGVILAKGGAGWLPVISSCAATVAVFTTEGIPLRVVLLGCTFLWLANNIISGSIGGVALESVIAIVNISTIIRMLRSLPEKPLLPDGVRV